MLQDSHAHLQAVNDREGMAQVLSGLERSGVGRIFCNSTSPEDWDQVSVLAEKHKEVIPFYGIHPWFADKTAQGWEERLLGFLKKKPACLGEIGLDRAREAVSFEAQRSVFERQVDIAFILKRPFTLHAVESWGACIESLAARGASKLPFIVHSFSGSIEVMNELIKLGGYISFSLKLVEKRYKKISEAFEAAPLERLLLETDFPYAPGSASKASAASADYIDCVKRIYEIASKMKGVDAEALEKAVWDNGTVFVH